MAVDLVEDGGILTSTAEFDESVGIGGEEDKGLT